MITEDQLEQQCLGWFREGGWATVFGPDIAHDGSTPERANYHQFHAVREAVRVTLIASQESANGDSVEEPRAPYGKEVVPGSRKAGVVWHTQGSGKSISMVCYAGKLIQQPEMKNPTLVVVTDRNDLDGQLYETFCGAQELLNQTPEQADSREELRQKLASRQAGGIIFTTIQKFAPADGEEKHPVLCDRSNVVVISDEAHRSQYGLKARLNTKTGKYVYGFAKHLRDALPTASFIGFTGTPIERDDKDIIALRPDWHDADIEKGAIKVVMTGSASDDKAPQPHVTTKRQKKRLEKRFKNPTDPLRLVIVRDMWLTGFDAPCCHTMYVDKPMKGHNLMQAIARVNRVFKDKPGGLVVDYIGIANDLKAALKVYADSNGRGQPSRNAEEFLEVHSRNECLNRCTSPWARAPLWAICGYGSSPSWYGRLSPSACQHAAETRSVALA